MPVIGCFQLWRKLPSIPANQRANSTSNAILVEGMETRLPVGAVSARLLVRLLGEDRAAATEDLLVHLCIYLEWYAK